jgi:polygalacturonase
MDMEGLMTGRISPRTVFKENYASFNIAMNISKAEDLIIDGQGSTLVFSGLIQPFEIKDCSNLIIRNLTIDWKRSMFSEGVVKMVKGEMLEVEVYPEFPAKGGEPVISFQSFSTSTGHLSGICQFTDISSLELVEPQIVRFKAYDAKFVKTGDIVIMRHMYNYRPGFNLFNCSNVRIQDVTIHALPGMGVFGTRTRDITLKRFNVRPSGRRIMSGNVDATHFVSCTGTIEIDSCYFEGMGDDATNVHSYYYTKRERIDDKTDLIANISKHARLKFTNNTVRDIRGRGILVQTRGALIENNRFEYCTGQGIHIDTAYPWMESVGTRDVVIRNNTFLNCGYGNTTYCDAIGIAVETECTQPYIEVHRNLTIENNLIIGQLKPAFYLSCLDGAIIKGNRVISNGVPARIEYAANIIFENNNFGEKNVVYGTGCLKIADKKH